MMSFGYHLGMLSLALVWPTSSAATPSQKAKWVSDWGDQRCALIRETGGSNPTVLVVRTVPGSMHSELWLLDPNWTGRTLQPGSEVAITLRPSGITVKERAFGVALAGRKGFAVSNLDSAFLKNFAGSTSVLMTQRQRELAEIPVPNSAGAFATLLKCEAEVLKSWGYDPQVIASLQSPPTPSNNPATWISNSDYPDEAIRAGLSGAVLVRLNIGADGAASDCILVEGSGHPLLDSRTCSLFLKRARFKPAVAADGSHTKGIVAYRMRWALPR
jgi:protein TonB